MFHHHGRCGGGGGIGRPGTKLLMLLDIGARGIEELAEWLNGEMVRGTGWVAEWMRRTSRSHSCQ
jgi:hypothetical protein